MLEAGDSWHSGAFLLETVPSVVWPASICSSAYDRLKPTLRPMGCGREVVFNGELHMEKAGIDGVALSMRLLGIAA